MKGRKPQRDESGKEKKSSQKQSNYASARCFSVPFRHERQHSIDHTISVTAVPAPFQRHVKSRSSPRNVLSGLNTRQIPMSKQCAIGYERSQSAGRSFPETDTTRELETVRIAEGAGRQVPALLQQNRVLEQTIESLKDKVVRIQKRLGGNKPDTDSYEEVTDPIYSPKQCYRDALQSLYSSCHRYISACPSDLSASLARQSLLSNLEMAKTCLQSCDNSIESEDGEERRNREIWERENEDGKEVIADRFDTLAERMAVFGENVEGEILRTQNRIEKLCSRVLTIRISAFEQRKALVTKYETRCRKLESALRRLQEEKTAINNLHQREVADISAKFSRDFTELRQRHYREIENLKKTDKESHYIAEIALLKRELETSRRNMSERTVKMTENYSAVESLKREVETLTRENKGLKCDLAAQRQSNVTLEKANLALTGKLQNEKRQIEGQIASLFSEMDKINDLQSEWIQRSERWEMTVNDFEGIVIRKDDEIAKAKIEKENIKKGAVIIAEIASVKETVEQGVQVLFEYAEDEAIWERCRMVYEDCSSRLITLEAAYLPVISSLEARVQSLQHENSALLLENSLLHQEDPSISLDASQLRPATPTETLQELNQVVSALKDHWSQELDNEEKLRLEIASLRAENWTMKQKIAVSAVASPVPISMKTSVDREVSAELVASISDYDSSALGRSIGSDVVDDSEFWKERAKKLEELEMIVFSRFPEEKDVVEIVKRLIVTDRRSVETQDLLPTAESRASLEPISRPECYDTPRSTGCGTRDDTASHRGNQEPASFPPTLKDAFSALIRSIPRK